VTRAGINISTIICVYYIIVISCGSVKLFQPKNTDNNPHTAWRFFFTRAIENFPFWRLYAIIRDGAHMGTRFYEGIAWVGEAPETATYAQLDKRIA